MSTYLDEKGLFLSRTWFYLRSCTRASEVTDFEEMPVGKEEVPSKKRKMCSVCFHARDASENTCLVCVQNEEYHQSLAIDSLLNDPIDPDVSDFGTGYSPGDVASNLNLEETTAVVTVPVTVRERHLTYLQYQSAACISTTELAIETATPALETVTLTTESAAPATETVTFATGSAASGDLSDLSSGVSQSSASNLPGPTASLTVTQVNVRKEMLTYFMMDLSHYSRVNFLIRNSKGEIEKGVGNGANREVYSLFWNEVATCCLIGEKERVPFIRHDLYKREWEAVGKILVQGYKDTSYFPLILSKAFICYTLFDNVPKEILLQGVFLYLSEDEADLLKQSISDFDNTDELYDVLEKFNCRKRVNSSNIRDVVIELARQELKQKPHIMASVMAPVLCKLLEFSCFTSEKLDAFYEAVKPTLE